MLESAQMFEETQKRREEVLAFLYGRLTPELYARVQRQLYGCYLVRHATDTEPCNMRQSMDGVS